jgi:hypothetical protein
VTCDFGLWRGRGRGRGVGAILLSLSAMSPLFLSLSGRLLIIVLKVGWR